MNILGNILSQEAVHKLGWTLLHSLWQGAVVVLLLVVFLRILHKSSANLRYLIFCLGLAVIILLPVVTFFVIPAPAPISDVESIPGSQPIVTGQLPEVYEADMPLRRAIEYMQISSVASWRQRAKNLYTSALPYIVFGWFIGVIAFCVWHFGGWLHLQRLKREKVGLVDESLKDKLHNLTEQLKVIRPVKLMESALVQIPTVVGWFRPVILLPASALSGLTPEQIEALLAHELAHIRRYDYLVNMFQTVVEILGFYHPAVWWISHKMRVERENCCDDLAVSVCGNKVGYARALASMEEIRLAQGELVIAADGGNLFTRISRLVGYESAGKARHVWTPVVLSALLIIVLAIPATLALTTADAAGGLQADNITTHVSEPLDERNINSSVAVRPESHLPETNSNIQIHFECVIYEVPADLKLFEGEQKEDKVGQMIWLGKEYADSLEVLSRKNKNVKVLSSPHVMTLDGEEASVAVGADVPYIAGYENGEDAGDEAKPIIKRGFAGLELKIKGKTKENGLRLDLNTNYGQLKPGFGVYKDDEGREIQVPVIESRKCATSISLGSDETVVIGGLKSQNDDNNQLFLVITPSIYLPEKDIESQVTIAKKIRNIDDEHVRIVQDFVAEVTEDKHISSLKTVKNQVDELREMLDGRVFSVQDCGTEDNTAMVIYKLEKEDNGKEVRWQVVFNLVKENGQWLINDIDFASLGDVKKKLTPPAQKSTEKEVDSSREHEALRQAKEYMEALQLYNQKSERPIMLEQFRTVLALEKNHQQFHENLNLLAASCAEHGDFAKAAEYQEMAIEIAKNMKYYGIGIAIEKKDGLIRISDVLPNTPAAGSSFQKGDIIETVDEISTEGMSLDDVVARIVGPKDTEVTLSVKSPGRNVTEKKTCTRQLPLEGSHVVRAYEWRLAAYKSGKTWPQYRRMMEEQKVQKDGATHIFVIKYASAEELAEVLSRILERRWKGVKDRSTQAVRIIPEPNRNRLIVIASEADIQLIKALITELDVLAKRDTSVIKAAPDIEYKQDPPAGSTITQVIKLKYADCENIEEILRQILSDEQFKIATDKRTNMLIVAGTKSAIEEIKALVAEIDVSVPEKNIEVGELQKQKGKDF